jgi:hypothetical protein
VIDDGSGQIDAIRLLCAVLSPAGGRARETLPSRRFAIRLDVAVAGTSPATVVENRFPDTKVAAQTARHSSFTTRCQASNAGGTDQGGNPAGTRNREAYPGETDDNGHQGPAILQARIPRKP